MKAPRVFAAAVAALLGLAGLGPVSAQDYPSRVITVIVPFAAGGPTDTVTRLVAESMSRDLGQTVVVENAGGAGGTIGPAMVFGYRAGYTSATGTSLP